MYRWLSQFFQRTQNQSAAADASSVTAPSLSVDDITSRAGRLIDSGSPEEGLVLLDEVPRTPQSVVFRAIALLKIGSQGQAVEAAREAASISSNAAVLAQAAAVLLQCGEHGEAFLVAVRSAELSASDRAVGVALAAARFLMRDEVWRRLSALCATLKARGARDASILLAHYAATSASGTFAEAGPLLEEAFDCASPDPPFWRAQRRVMLRDFDGARADFAEARRRGGRSADIEFREASLLRAFGDLEGAAQLVRPSDVLDTNKPYAWVALGRLKDLQGDTEAARDSYAAALIHRIDLPEEMVDALERDRSAPNHAEAVADALSLVELGPLDRARRGDLMARLRSLGASSTDRR